MMSDRATTIMDKLYEENALAKKHNLDNYHSGGGCFHLAYFTNVEGLMWLINDIDESNEPSMDYPTNENQRCMFGLDLSYLEDDAITERIIEILDESNDLFKSKFNDHSYFYATFENGVKKMKAITNKINSLKSHTGLGEKFVVIWNRESYGEVEPRIITFNDFVNDGIGGEWNIDEDGEFTLNHLRNLKLGETLEVYSPIGWDIKVIKIKEVS
jgi:hypothetical protein